MPRHQVVTLKEFSAWRSYDNCPLDINIPVKQTSCAAPKSLRQAFDFSASKWGHGSSMSWASFLPIFSLLRFSVLDFVSGTGQTDGRTEERTDDGHRCIMPPPYGCGGITITTRRPVMVRLERSSLVETEVLGLVISQFGEVGTKPRQMDTGCILICTTDTT